MMGTGWNLIYLWKVFFRIMFKKSFNFTILHDEHLGDVKQGHFRRQPKFHIVLFCLFFISVDICFFSQILR